MHREILTAAQKRLWAKLAGVKWIDAFYLGGGTALALHLGHRESVDFDFFSADPFAPEALIPQLQELGSVSVVQIDARTLHTSVAGVKTSFFAYSHELLAPLEVCEQINIASVEDIVPMKMIAIAQRGTKKDFYDIYAILEAGWTIDAMFEAVDRKFLKVHYNKMHILKSLTFFEDAEGDPAPKSLRAVKWNAVKERVSEEAKTFIL